MPAAHEAVIFVLTELQKERPLLAIFQGGPAYAYEAEFIHGLVERLTKRYPAPVVFDDMTGVDQAQPTRGNW